MFDSTQPAQQTRPTSVARPNKKYSERPITGPRPSQWAQCYSLNNWISHWCKVSSFHWTTLRQDTLDIAGAGYEYDFLLLYTGYFLLVQGKITTQVYNSGVTDGGRLIRVQTSPWQTKCKNWVSILVIFRYSVFFWFSVNCFFAFFGCFWTVVLRWFRVLVSLYRNPHPDTLSFPNFVLNVGEGPDPTVASGPLSATFLTLAKTSNYATGLQLNFSE